MHRRKVTVVVVAVFAIGVAFAAQPTSLRADWGNGRPQQGSPWVPGSYTLMSAHEPSLSVLAPPP
jgi:hypothetical protein